MTLGNATARHPERTPADNARSRLSAGKVLLLAGIGAPAAYALGDAIAGSIYDYSFRDQTISELAAIGSDTRPLFISMLFVSYALLAAFGLGIWRAAEGRRGLLATAAIFGVVGVISCVLTPFDFVSMRQRGEDQGINGTLHLAVGAVVVPMFIVAMISAAAALPRWFRWCTAAAIALLLGFGFWTGLDASRINDGLDTPWVGVKERVSVYAYQAWIALLAVRLMGDAGRPT